MSLPSLRFLPKKRKNTHTPLYQNFPILARLAFPPSSKSFLPAPENLTVDVEYTSLPSAGHLPKNLTTHVQKHHLCQPAPGPLPPTETAPPGSHLF